jgi:hypothetical protein
VQDLPEVSSGFSKVANIEMFRFTSPGKARLILTCVVPLYVYGQAPAPDAAQTLTVRLRPDVSVDTLKALAQAAAPDQQTLARQGGVGELLRDEYGSSHEKIRALFQAFNPGVKNADVAAGNATVNLPVGPKWKFNVRVPAEPGLTIREQVQQLMGDSGPRTQELFEALNPQWVGKWDQMATGVLVMPYVTEYVTYRLRDGADRDSLLKTLQREQPKVAGGFSAGQRLIPSLTHLSGATEGCGEKGQKTVDSYGPRLAQVLPSPLSPTTIAVLDSGVAQNDPRFQFWKKSRASLADRGLGSLPPPSRDSIWKRCHCGWLSLDATALLRLQL